MRTCGCDVPRGFDHEVGCHTLADDLPTPQLVSWKMVEKDMVDVIWTNAKGHECRTTLRVDSDINGLTFHHDGGSDIQEAGDWEATELLESLDHDMADLRGSEFIPINPRHHRVHPAHQVKP